MQVLLIRHGQSANNAQAEHLRVPDPALTELGIQQAAATAAWLAEISVDHLYCSPFLRALETARPIALTKNLAVRVRADLFEQGGCYSGHEPGAERGEPGLGKSALRQQYPGWHIDESIPETGWWGREFETLAQARQRATQVANWLAGEAKTLGGMHVLVIHADFKRLLLEAMLQQDRSGALPNGDLAGATLFNTGVSTLAWGSDGWQLHSLNSTQHLPPQLVT